LGCSRMLFAFVSPVIATLFDQSSPGISTWRISYSKFQSALDSFLSTS
jgi:hypothetical protein